VKLDAILDDAYLDLLMDAVRLFDAQLSKLEREADRSKDPDMSGHLDRMEYVTGLGFVACQQYMTGSFARKNINRRAALDLGPKHRCGVTFAALVNAAANHWKHHTEWDEQKGANLRAEQTAVPLETLGVNLRQPYVLANILHELLRPHASRFQQLIPFLTRWRDEVLDTDANQR
jgi:hypothetical protein